MSYYPDETVSKIIRFKDKDNVDLDPDETSVSIIDAKGAEQASPPSLDQISAGVYELNYNLPSDAAAGGWFIIIEATKGTFKSIEKDMFSVQKLL